MFNCFKKKKEEPEKGLEIVETSTPFHIHYNNILVGYITKGEDGRHRARLNDSTEWGSADLLDIVGELQDLNMSR